MLPTEQTCPDCRRPFIGSDAIGDSCSDCRSVGKMLPQIPLRPKLDALLKASAKHKMTPAEIWDQRVSWAYGNQPHDSTITREQVEARAIEMYGPRPLSLDDIPEYCEMRKGLMALRLVVDPSVADDILSICEKAILTVREESYQRGYKDAEGST